MNRNVISRIQELGDLGLACVLCIVAEQHGIVLADAEDLDNAAKEIATRCSEDLGLATVVIECSQGTDLDYFRENILVDYSDDRDEEHHSPLESLHISPQNLSLDDRRVADVVVAKNLNFADENVQVQALELIRSKRIYTRTAMHSTGKTFVLIALNTFDSDVAMSSHLTDLFAIAHHHSSVDASDSESTSTKSRFTSDSTSFRSVVRGGGSSIRSSVSSDIQISPGTLVELRRLAEAVTMTAEVSAYLQNIIVAMRLHRYVAGGISALATRHMRVIAKAMAVLHGLDYVTPAIVGLATRKVYLHRLVLADEKTERSLRWGSDPVAVKENMLGVTAESAIDTVLSTVQAPL